MPKWNAIDSRGAEEHPTSSTWGIDLSSGVLSTNSLVTIIGWLIVLCVARSYSDGDDNDEMTLMYLELEGDYRVNPIWKSVEWFT